MGLSWNVKRMGYHLLTVSLAGSTPFYVNCKTTNIRMHYVSRHFGQSILSSSHNCCNVENCLESMLVAFHKINATCDEVYESTPMALKLNDICQRPLYKTHITVHKTKSD